MLQKIVCILRRCHFSHFQSLSRADKPSFKFKSSIMKISLQWCRIESLYLIIKNDCDWINGVYDEKSAAKKGYILLNEANVKGVKKSSTRKQKHKQNHSIPAVASFQSCALFNGREWKKNEYSFFSLQSVCHFVSVIELTWAEKQCTSLSQTQKTCQSETTWKKQLKCCAKNKPRRHSSGSPT